MNHPAHSYIRITQAKTKIAILIDWYLPGTRAGGPVRSIFSLITLLKDEFDIYLFTKNHDLGNSEPYANVQADTLIEKDGVHYYYFSEKEAKMSSIIKRINSVSPDLIYLNSLWSYSFSIGIVKAFHTGKIKSPVLLAPRGMLGKGAMSLKAFKKQLFLSYARLFSLYHGIYFHATNEQEEQDILRRFPKAKIYLAPNLSSAMPLNKNRAKEKGKLRLFYLSRIARVKNLHYGLELLRNLPPHITLEYDIYGNAEDKTYWEECKNLIARLPENIRVTLKGELKFHEVQQTISSYHALLLPTLNENFGHSLVESLMCGCPIITSDQTPWNEVTKIKAGYALPLNDKQAFLNAVIELAEMNQEEFDKASERAINYISNKLNIPLCVSQYKTLFDECAKNRSF